MWNFLKEKRLSSYVSGNVVKPNNTIDNYVTELDTRESNNTKILTWIHNSLSNPLLHS